MPVDKRIDIAGSSLVFVTTTVIDWLPVFSLEKAASETVMQLGETSRHFNVAIIGYVLMPSHIHALLGFPNISILSRFMQAFKSLSSRRLKAIDLGRFRKQLFHKGHFRLWKRRYDDLIIYTEKQLRIKLEYIHNNPVKDGLVDDPIKWGYSSASDWLSQEKGLVEINKEYSWMNPSYVGGRGRPPTTVN